MSLRRAGLTYSELLKVLDQGWQDQVVPREDYQGCEWHSRLRCVASRLHLHRHLRLIRTVVNKVPALGVLLFLVHCAGATVPRRKGERGGADISRTTSRRRLSCDSTKLYVAPRYPEQGVGTEILEEERDALSGPTPMHVVPSSYMGTNKFLRFSCSSRSHPCSPCYSTVRTTTRRVCRVRCVPRARRLRCRSHVGQYEIPVIELVECDDSAEATRVRRHQRMLCLIQNPPRVNAPGAHLPVGAAAAICLLSLPPPHHPLLPLTTSLFPPPLLGCSRLIICQPSGSVNPLTWDNNTHPPPPGPHPSDTPTPRYPPSSNEHTAPPSVQLGTPQSRPA